MGKAVQGCLLLSAWSEASEESTRSPGAKGRLQSTRIPEPQQSFSTCTLDAMEPQGSQRLWDKVCWEKKSAVQVLPPASRQGLPTAPCTCSALRGTEAVLSPQLPDLFCSHPLPITLLGKDSGRQSCRPAALAELCQVTGVTRQGEEGSIALLNKWHWSNVCLFGRQD